jgi:hypothetical protein
VVQQVLVGHRQVFTHLRVGRAHQRLDLVPKLSERLVKFRMD